MIPKSDHPISRLFQKPRSGLIRFNVGRMLAAVQLDHQLAAAADKVGEKRADRDLPAELVAVETPPPELQPQQLLAIRRVVPPLLCAFRPPSRLARHRHSPTPPPL